jgi:predicted SAM-dependent methyltransferase
LFKPGTISNLLAEHVVEHIERHEFEKFLSAIKPFLDDEASIRIAVPDSMHPSSYVRELTMPSGLEPGAEDHRYFYSIYDMQKIAYKTGYQIIPLEYFDKNGIFYSVEDDWERGYISNHLKNIKVDLQTIQKKWEKMLDSIPQAYEVSLLKKNLQYVVDCYFFLQ